ncbi:MAG: molybdopterin-dependent oxidoreductase [Armatimonadetes bacterium]|nr:molybdopterin-dependent oxidoreductase [Armatimonadota bacterium]
MATGSLVGMPLKRVEDPRLITGNGHYLDDIKLPGMVHVAVVRSRHAHAQIARIDTGRAAAVPGVLAVYTGRDLQGQVSSLPCAWQAGGVPNNVNTPPVLALDRVRWTGDAIAAVVAETPAIAEDAARLVEVEYAPLPVVVDAQAATNPGAPQLHDNAPDNVCMRWTAGDDAAAQRALQDADVVVRQRLINQRLIPNPIEGRGAIGRYDPGTGEYTVWMTSQAPHVMRLLLAAFVLGVPEHKVRCISPDVGGGFGAKIFLYGDMALVAWCSRQLGGRPVKFVESRRENYVATTHGRDHVTEIEVGARKDGTITALRVKTYANLGAYLSTIAPGIPTTLYGRMLAGCYRIPHIFCEVLGVYTNTAMVDAYRGAGRPEATYAVERAVDLVAAKLSMDPAEVRRKNFIPPDAFPYKNPVGMLPYDSGDYGKTLAKALEMVRYDEFRREQEVARRQGRYLGIGLSSYVEVCGVAPSAWIGLPGEGWGAGLWESANVRMHLTGKVVVTTGSLPHGQGHETTVAQIVADELGVPMDDVTVEHGDTLGTPFGYGTYGSRSAAVGGVAVYRSLQKVKDKARRLGAHLLEASEADVVYEGGKVFVKGAPDRSKTIQEIALAASVAYNLPKGMEPFLDETSYYDPPNCTFPFGTQVAVVEVDPETGRVELKRYVAVDDVGKVINPLIVDGQVHGGIVQGVGQALWEGAVYDANGQLVTGSMMDYAVPRAAWFPTLEVARTETLSPVNPLGVKGAGETGTIAATPAVVNAVVDALRPLGIHHLDMPLTPERVWRAMQSKR